MILNNLAVLLAERNMKISELSTETGLSRSTLTTLSNNDSSGIQSETLDKICVALEVSPGDFFSFYPATFGIDIEEFEYDDENDDEPIYLANLRIWLDKNWMVEYSRIDCSVNLQYTSDATFHANFYEISEQENSAEYDNFNKIEMPDRHFIEFSNLINTLPTVFKYSILNDIYQTIAKNVFSRWVSENKDVSEILIHFKSSYGNKTITYTI
ncbi:helix-turn-helix transcriptional regulator [Listeria monocytogenes]|nr:XRE family transcriptional regulator [Listeria monocytogenes]EAC7306371.1 XRE family transcriptional regulator [Listeria monocytogenes]EEO2018280.1 helix-turn-helix transcriptional regulator [Listeria monocytogenes]EEO6477082.1 helix-turn-helix transcriptional regulator [Listeria monocytogenes]